MAPDCALEVVATTTSKTCSGNDGVSSFWTSGAPLFENRLPGALARDVLVASDARRGSVAVGATISRRASPRRAGVAAGWSISDQKAATPEVRWSACRFMVADRERARENSEGVRILARRYVKGLSRLRKGSLLRPLPQPLDGRHQSPVRSEPAARPDRRRRHAASRVRLHPLPQGRQGHQGPLRASGRAVSGAPAPQPVARR